MREALDVMVARTEVARDGEHREVLETSRMFADDRGWMRRMHDAVRGGLTAEAAVQKIQKETRGRMAALKDPYLHARLADSDELGRSEERRVGKEGFSTGRTRWSAEHPQKKKSKKNTQKKEP